MTEIDRLIKKGHRIISYPTVIISILTFIITLFAFEKIEYFKTDLWYFAISKIILMLFLMIFIPLLYRSFMLQFWKIKSFENVNNVHELKKRAIQEEILFDENNPLSKFEFYTRKNKEKWNSILNKFRTNDVFIDDLSIKNNTFINYPKPSYFIIALISFYVIMGIKIIIKTKEFDALLSVGIGVVIAYYHFRGTSWFNKKNQIIIDENGIKTINTDFYKWNEIKNEKIIIEEMEYGNKKNYFLFYNHPKGAEKFKINKLDTNVIKLEHLIKIYRGRFNKTKGVSIKS